MKFKGLNVARVIVLVLSIGLILPELFWTGVGVGPLSSLQIALNLAWEQRNSAESPWVFGRTFVGTYGPLGFLTTRIVFEAARWPLAFFDVIRTIIFIGLIYSALIRLTSQIQVYIFLTIVFCFGRYHHYSSFPCLFFILQTAMMLFHLETKSWLFLFLAATTSIVLFFTDLSVGLPSLALFYCYLAHYGYYQSRLLEGLISGILCSCAIFVIANFLPIELIPYLKMSPELLVSKSEFVPLGDSTEPLRIARALTIFAAFLISCLFSIKDFIRSPTFRLTSALCFVSFIIILKHTFLGTGREIQVFFRLAPLILGIAWLWGPKLQRYFLLAAFTLAFIFAYPFTSLEFAPIEWKRKPVEVAEVIQTVKKNREDPVRLKINNLLPIRFIETIGQSSVDILPHDLSHLYSYSLNYLPRPIIQSWHARTPTLDRLNAAHFSSASAPEFVILSSQTLNNYYLMLEDALSKFELLKCYTPVAVESGWVLLKKRPTQLIISESSVRSEKSRLGVSIEVPKSSQPLIFSASVNLSLWGWLKTILFRAPHLQISLALEDGTSESFTAGRALLRSGFYIGGLVNSPSDLFSFFGQNFSGLTKIKSITLESKEDKSFLDEIEFKFFDKTISHN